MRTQKEIWILEDECEYKELFQFMLSSKYALTFFDSIEFLSAFLKQSSSTPDLLIADLNLPDGNFATDFLSKLKTKPAFPVLIISGMDDATIGQVCMEFGATSFLSKPFNHTSLIFTIEKAFVSIPDKKTNLQNVIGHTLTKKERLILNALASSPDKRLHEDELVKILWKGSFPLVSNSLNVHIANLRKKLAPHAYTIQTLPNGFWELKQSHNQI